MLELKKLPRVYKAKNLLQKKSLTSNQIPIKTHNFQKSTKPFSTHNTFLLKFFEKLTD